MSLNKLAQEPLLYRLDVRTKLLGFISFTVLALMFQNPFYNLGLTLFVAILAFSARMPLTKARAMLIPLLPIFFFILVVTAFSYPGDRFRNGFSQNIIFYLLPGQRLGATVGGILMGLNFLFRLLTMVLASSVFSLTTPLDDLLQFLQKAKVPPELAFMIVTALRFIPALDKKRIHILEAQKARGAHLGEKSLTGNIKAYIPIMVPLIIHSIQMADALSMAMLNRGYGYTRTWTGVRERTLRLEDYLAIFFILSMTALGIYLRYFTQRGTL
ncbi:energy-coupling factor transporter transmembrane component T [Paradesulfitobacterium aromaticivorans]